MRRDEKDNEQYPHGCHHQQSQILFILFFIIDRCCVADDVCIVDRCSDRNVLSGIVWTNSHGRVNLKDSSQKLMTVLPD